MPRLENGNSITNQSAPSERGEKTENSNAIKIPQISLPKGGGAFKGIDEKFEVNSANGTASYSIPLPLTPNRNNFTPQLYLSYNSGGGNSAFGLGWSLGIPSIQRKTDKKLPLYIDEDTFLFSGAEDLVPFLELREGRWQEPETGNTGDFVIKRFRPRTEGSFARIEKITHPDHGVYWRVTGKDNTTTFFGFNASYRVSDPADDTKIFEWLPEFSSDQKGSWIQYHYKKENQDLVPSVLHENNRNNEKALITNQYLKRARYGNANSFIPSADFPYIPQFPDDTACFFELVFDYGEHHLEVPLPEEDVNQRWAVRPDPFSSYRSGFEIRTYRLCQRVLMFHQFPTKAGFETPCLVRSLNLQYEPSSINGSGQAEVTYLQKVTQYGYIREEGVYSKRALPPIEFTYERLNWNKEIRFVDAESLVHAPVGLTNNYQWVDLYGEGISGILTEQANGWFYKSNIGDENDAKQVAFTRAQPVIPKPSFEGLSTDVLSLQDLESNGLKQVVLNATGLHGFFELDENLEWNPFTAFSDVANVNWKDPNTRLIDLNGDGQAELVVTEENVFVWYGGAGKKGYHSPLRTPKSFDEELGPAIVFADLEQTIFLADMSGDGLTDIVRIRNGEICYWANKGFGYFSAKVNMSNAPIFDFPDLFNPKNLHLADVSGTGATDIIYTGQNSFKAYINLSGNSWSEVHEIDPFFPIHSNTQLSVVDLLGTGTSCIVWSSDLPSDNGTQMRYIDLMNSKKPHVMTKHINNLGKETTLKYKSSTAFYLKDKLNGTPWITRLPFPVQVVESVEVYDKWRETKFCNSYSYHHGYYDHGEREFRGFGRVEQTDVEDYGIFSRGNVDSPYITDDQRLFQPPVKTITWIHTGAFISRKKY